MLQADLPRQSVGKRLFQGGLNAAVYMILRPKVIWMDKEMKKRKNREPFVFVCNHTHHFDGVCLAAVLHRYKPYALVSRKWYDKKGCGTLIKKTRSIPINLTELDAAWYPVSEQLINQGESMLIFPEGAVAREGKMLDFKPGAGLVAAKTGVAVVPVASLGTYKMLFGRRQKILIGKPLRIARPENMRNSLYAKIIMNAAEGEVKRLYGLLERKYESPGTYFAETD